MIVRQLKLETPRYHELQTAITDAGGARLAPAQGLRFGAGTLLEHLF